MGYDIYAGWAKQTTDYDTLEARAKFSRVYSDSDLMHERPSDPKTHVGNLDPDEQHYTLERGTGRLVLPAQYKDQHDLHEAALGIREADSPPNTRVIKLANSLPANGLSVELHKGFPDAGNEAKLMTGGKVSTFAIQAAIDEEIRYDYGLIGKKVDLGAKTVSPTFQDLDTRHLLAKQIAVQIDAASANVFSVEINLDNNLTDSRGFLGSTYIAEPIRAPGKRTITGTISKEWTDKTLYDKFLSGASAELILTATGPSPFVAVWTVGKMIFTAPEEETVEVDQIPQSLPWRAVSDGDDTLKLTETTDVSL